MANDVFANTREVSCKAASGKSIAAMPDVCFTPPLTPATPPGVPIPYPNTGMASDTSGGTKTVKISGDEAMIKDSSFFKKSSGDEAGNAPKKGVITSQITGKVYFTAWSMDIKFEGENVVRHLDLTTHNHASLPGNTPPWAYTDTMDMQVNNEKDPCKETRENVETKCEKQLADNTYSTGRVNQSGFKDDMCASRNCKAAMKCVLTPFNNGCCKGKTPHHVIPAHCFMPPGARGDNTSERFEGCENYDVGSAPCICVDGEGKWGTHGEIHAIFDDLENSHKPPDGDGTWSYNQAADAGASSTSEVTGCDENCTKAQLNRYHQGDPETGGAGMARGTKLRADSSGAGGIPDGLTVV